MTELSPKAAKRLARLICTLERALVQMDGSVEIYEIISNWHGSANIRDNIREFVDWQSNKLDMAHP